MLYGRFQKGIFPLQDWNSLNRGSREEIQERDIGKGSKMARRTAKEKLPDVSQVIDETAREKGLSRDSIISAIEKAVISAFEQEYGKGLEPEVVISPENGEFLIQIKKKVVEKVENPVLEMSLEEAKHLNPDSQIGDEIPSEVRPRDLNRRSAQKITSIMQQNIKEGERKVLYDHFKSKEHDIVTGIVTGFHGNDLQVSLDGMTEETVNSRELIPTEHYKAGDRIRLYIVEVREGRKRDRTDNRGNARGDCQIVVSRTHPDLVRKLFEHEVSEIADGTVEIKSIARDAGSRSKIAVYSHDENVDPVGACVGMNGTRVDNIVSSLGGEKMDIIEWNEDPEIYIENALRPSKVVSVMIGEDGKDARVVVPDYQLSLAIGKGGQNARLAAKLTGYKIDIKSETQERELEEEEMNQRLMETEADLETESEEESEESDTTEETAEEPETTEESPEQES